METNNKIKVTMMIKWLKITCGFKRLAFIILVFSFLCPTVKLVAEQTEDVPILEELKLGGDVGPVKCTINLKPMVNGIAKEIEEIEGHLNQECNNWHRSERDWEECGRSARNSVNRLRVAGEKLKTRLADCAACLDKKWCKQCPYELIWEDFCSKAEACKAALPGALDATIESIIVQAMIDISSQYPIDYEDCRKACTAKNKLHQILGI